MHDSQSIRSILIHALTQYDARQSKRAHYNPYALGKYFERIGEIVADVERGATLRAAVCAGFTGSVQAACLRALGLPEASDDEWHGRSAVMHYVPASQA